jgi:hypothetical protein
VSQWDAGEWCGVIYVTWFGLALCIGVSRCDFRDAAAAERASHACADAGGAP